MLLLLGHSAEEAGGGVRQDQPLADAGGGIPDITLKKYNSNTNFKTLITD